MSIWSVGSWLHPSLISPGVHTGATTSQPKSKWRSYDQNSVGNKTGQSPRLLKNHKVCFNMIEASLYPFLPPSRKKMLIKCAAATHPTSNNHWTVTWLKATTFWGGPTETRGCFSVQGYCLLWDTPERLIWNPEVKEKQGFTTFSYIQFPWSKGGNAVKGSEQSISGHVVHFYPTKTSLVLVLVEWDRLGFCELPEFPDDDNWRASMHGQPLITSCYCVHSNHNNVTVLCQPEVLLPRGTTDEWTLSKSTFWKGCQHFYMCLL